MRRLIVATLSALVALALIAPSVLANWPTTCVEANDAFEFAAGNHHNIGLYQRVYGAEAERFCQIDHGNDIRAAFGWAFGNTPPPVPPQQAPAPHATPVPSTHPDYERVRRVAEARGASAAKAAEVAASVVGREVDWPGTVDGFLRGADEGVEYGLHACDWQSDACPLAPQRVVCLDMDRDPNFRRSPDCPYIGIDDGLVDAYKLIEGLDVEGLLGEFGLYHWDDSPGAFMHTVWIRWADIPDAGTFRFYGQYDGYRNIRVSSQLRHLEPALLAGIIAHELSHASVPSWQARDNCLWDEVLAFTTEVLVAAELRPVDFTSAYARGLQPLARILVDLRDQPGWQGNDDLDLTEWLPLASYIWNDRGYDERCQN